MALVLNDPPISIAIGMKIWALLISVYFVFFVMAALSAAAPACRVALSR